MCNEETTLLNLVRRVQELEKKVCKLETDTIITKTELPVDVLQENGLLPPEPTTTKRGKGYRPLLQGEIEEAKSKTKNESRAAKYLGVSFKTYKKYCKLYGIWNPKR